jgi:hypothetical protein
MTSASPSSLAELCTFSSGQRPWLIDLVQEDIGGGRTSIKDLAVLDDRPGATALIISGLDQRAFEALAHTYGPRFSGIYFWKCPRIEDLTPLEDLPNLKYVAFYWNQRTSRLWDFSRNPVLRGLQFVDFTRIHDLDDLPHATTVEELRIGNAVWPKWVLKSLGPLESLTQLRSLNLDLKTIEDGRIQPLAALQRLESLEFPTNQFTTRQVAWLRARLPDSMRSKCLGPTYALDEPIGEGADAKDVFIVGKRKPFLNSQLDADRIERYAEDFWRMVEEFRQNPEMQPD